MKFGFAGRAAAETLKLLRTCVGLRNLEVVITDKMTPCDFLRDRDFGLRKFYDGKFDLLKIRGMRDLLRIRGIATLKVVPDDLIRYFISSRSMYDGECKISQFLAEFEEALQILKQPYVEMHLPVQDREDFSPKVANSVNVVTRAKKKLIAG